MADNQFTTHTELFDLSGKHALVTGGTRGIGMMIARGLLQAGARVVISSRKAERARRHSNSCPNSATFKQSPPTCPGTTSVSASLDLVRPTRDVSTSLSTTRAQCGASR